MLGQMAGKHAAANGFITRNIVDSMAFCPPLIINKHEIDDLIGRVGKTLDNLLTELGNEIVN